MRWGWEATAEMKYIDIEDPDPSCKMFSRSRLNVDQQLTC